MLRPEILRREHQDGSLSLLDPLLQTAIILSPEEHKALSQTPLPPALLEKLEDHIMLEDEGAKALRESFWHAKQLLRLSPSPYPSTDQTDWTQASKLPSIIRSPWRQAAPWKKSYERMRAGNDILIMDDLFEPQPLLDHLAQLSFPPYHNKLLQASRTPVNDGPIWKIMHNPIFRSFVHALIGLPSASNHVLVHAWSLEPGDYIGLHSDGPRYQGTLSVGCTPHWTADQGGAIAFGRPTACGFDVTQRWTPELGSALLFAPKANLWHGVEEVQKGTRHTLTGWWTDQKPHHHASHAH